MTILELKGEHPRIFDHIVKARIAQGNHEDVKCDCSLDDTLGMGNFDWDMSKDGVDFWDCIWCDDYDVFYEKYPEPLIDDYSLI